MRIFNAEAQRRRVRRGDGRVEHVERVEGERIFNAEARNRPLRVGATHREATKPSEASAESTQRDMNHEIH